MSLTNPTVNVTFTVAQILPRCDAGCRGVGMGVGEFSGTVVDRPMGCSGALLLPTPGVANCGNDTTVMLLRDFVPNPHFGGTTSGGVCRGPVCAAKYGFATKVRPKHKHRPVRVHAVPAPGRSDAMHETVVQFHDNHVPVRSTVIGPLRIRCTKHSSRLTVGADSKIENVLVDCPGLCPLHVKLRRHGERSHTKIKDVQLQRHVVRGDVLAEADMCSTLITPVSNKNHPLDFVARGKVEVETAYGHNIAVANVNGELIVTNKKGDYEQAVMNVTMLDSLEDLQGTLKITVTKGSGPVHIHNLTQIMDVFSQEYMVDFFGQSPLEKTELRALTRLNWHLAAVILALLAGDPDTIPRAMPSSLTWLPGKRPAPQPPSKSKAV